MSSTHNFLIRTEPPRLFGIFISESTHIFCFCQHATNQCISKSTSLQMSRIVPADISTRRHSVLGKTRRGPTLSPPRRNVKGKRIGGVVEATRPPRRAEPSTARGLQAARRVTRLSPAHLCLLHGCTRRGWAAVCAGKITLGAYIIHQTRHMLGRFLCSGRIPAHSTQKLATGLGMKQS